MRRSYEAVASSVYALFNSHWDKIQNQDAVNALLTEAGGAELAELSPRIFSLYKESFTEETLVANPKLAKLYRFTMDASKAFNDKSIHAVVLLLYSKELRSLFCRGDPGTDGYLNLFNPSRRALDNYIRKPSDSNFEKLDLSLSKLSDELVKLQTYTLNIAEVNYALHQYETYIVSAMLREPMNRG